MKKDIQKIITNYYRDAFGELDVPFEEDSYLVDLRDNILKYIKAKTTPPTKS